MRWSLGLGVISSPRPYVGADNKITPIPLVGLTTKKFYVNGIRAGYHFVDNEKFTFDGRVNLVFAGLDPDDSPALEGMLKRDPTVEGGLVFIWKPGPYRLSTAAYTDLLGRSDGQQVELDFSRTWVLGGFRWALTPTIGAVWQSTNYIDYYYGVTPEEARPGRPVFEGHSAVNFQSSLLVLYRVSRRVYLAGLVQVQRLDNEIYESPIVDDRRAYFGLIGATYQFGGSSGRP